MNPDHVYRHNTAYQLIHDGRVCRLMCTGDSPTQALNETAALIWKLIDGRRSHSEIETMLSQSFPDAAQEIGDNLATTLDALVELGAIEPTGDRNSRLRIAIVTLITAEIESYGRYSEAINRSYAETHDYEFIVARKVLFNDRTPAWSKVALLQKHLPDWDYVFWLDADAVVTRFDTTLETFIQQHPDKNILACDDRPNGGPCINAGTLIVKRSEWTMKFLEHWCSLGGLPKYAYSFLSDQKAFNDLHEQNVMNLQDNLHIFPANAFNSDYPAQKTHDDTFIMHLMTDANDERERVFRNIYERLSI